jgi:hypothetical protein
MEAVMITEDLIMTRISVWLVNCKAFTMAFLSVKKFYLKYNLMVPMIANAGYETFCLW